MTINPLSSSLVNLLSDDALTYRDKSGEIAPESSFSDILTETLNTASQTDTDDKISAIKLLTGQEDDMSGLALDATKAELSLQMAIQFRNKIVEAYNEIMRIQV